jgi:DNA-binding protein H-NS
MSKPYAVLLQEIKTMQAHAEIVKQRELVGVIAKIREAIKAYSITMAELYANGNGAEGRGSSAVSHGKGYSRRDAPLLPKFSDGNGNVWGGRGPRPRWLKAALASGKKLSDFER